MITLPKRIENVVVYFGKESSAENNKFKVMAVLSSSPIQNITAAEKAAGVEKDNFPQIFAHVKWASGEWSLREYAAHQLPVPGPQERWLVNLVLRSEIYVATPIRFLSSRSLKALEILEPQSQYLAEVADPALGSERK